MAEEPGQDVKYWSYLGRLIGFRVGESLLNAEEIADPISVACGIREFVSRYTDPKSPYFEGADEKLSNRVAHALSIIEQTDLLSSAPEETHEVCRHSYLSGLEESCRGLLN